MEISCTDNGKLERVLNTLVDLGYMPERTYDKLKNFYNFLCDVTISYDKVCVHRDGILLWTNGIKPGEYLELKKQIM